MDHPYTSYSPEQTAENWALLQKNAFSYRIIFIQKKVEKCGFRETLSQQKSAGAFQGSRIKNATVLSQEWRDVLEVSGCLKGQVHEGALDFIDSSSVSDVPHGMLPKPMLRSLLRTPRNF